MCILKVGPFMGPNLVISKGITAIFDFPLTVHTTDSLLYSKSENMIQNMAIIGIVSKCSIKILLF